MPFYSLRRWDRSAGLRTRKSLEFVDEVVKAVEIPVMVKLSQVSITSQNLQKLQKKQVLLRLAALMAKRSILGVDIEKGKTLLPTYGGYSGLQSDRSASLLQLRLHK